MFGWFPTLRALDRATAPSDRTLEPSASAPPLRCLLEHAFSTGRPVAAALVVSVALACALASVAAADGTATREFAAVKPAHSIPANIPKLGTRLHAWLHVFRRDRVNHYNGYELGDNGGGDAPDKTDLGFLPVVHTDAGTTDAIVVNLGGPRSLAEDQGPAFYENKNGDAPVRSLGRVDRVQITTADRSVIAVKRALLPKGARLVAQDGDTRSGCDATIWRGPDVYPKAWLRDSGWNGPLYYFIVHYTSVIYSGTMGPITLVGISEGAANATQFC